MNKPGTTLAERYRKEIKLRAQGLGLDTKTLARLAGVNRSGLSTFLNGSGNPTLDWIDKVIRAMKRRRKRPRSPKRGEE